MKEKNVSFTIFTWFASVVIAALVWMGSVVASANTKADNATTSNADLRVQLSQIQTDIQWIKLKLSR